VPRWDPETEERLRTAAIELFLEYGYDNVTVTQITDRAGLTRRTFSRHFADKRDVLFAGSDQLPPLLAAAVEAASSELTPYEALIRGFIEVGTELGQRVAAHAAERRTIISSSPELQERGRTKMAAVTASLATALRNRHVEPTTATLLASIGATLFQTAFDRWASDPTGPDLPAHIRNVAGEIINAIAHPRPSKRPQSKP
jgi:AcrR family transcriptional regulator